MKKVDKYFSPFVSVDQIYVVCIVLFALMAFFRDFSTNYYLLDTIEHIRASLAVASGLVPYVDFFEHHHPLLWCLAAPLAKLLNLKIAIIPIFRILGTMAYMGCIYATYRLAKNLYNKKTAQVITLCLIAVPTLWLDISNLRPDSFMLLFFLIGLNLFFDYSDTKQEKYLVLSYLSVTISFLFLQKAAFLVLPFGIFNLYALKKKEIKLNHFIWACIVGALPIVAVLLGLIYTGTLTDFLYYNYTFNTHMNDYYGQYVSGVSAFLKFVALIAFLLVIRVYKPSFKRNLIFLIFLFLGFSLLYFAPHSWYYIPYFVFASLLLGKRDSLCKNRVAVCSILAVFICSIICMFPQKTDRMKYEKYISDVESTVKQNMYDNMLDFAIFPINIFGPIKNFYWFGFHNVVIIDVIYNQNRYLSIDKFIKKTMPKYLVLSSSSGFFTPRNSIAWQQGSWFRYHNLCILQKMRKFPELKTKIITIDTDFWQIDQNWIKENYTQIEGTDVYKRNDLKE